MTVLEYQRANKVGVSPVAATRRALNAKRTVNHDFKRKGDAPQHAPPQPAPAPHMAAAAAEGTIIVGRLKLIATKVTALT